VVARRCFDNTHMQELGGRLLKFPGADVVSDRQAVDIKKPRNHTLRNLLGQILPYEASVHVVAAYETCSPVSMPRMMKVHEHHPTFPT